MDWLLYDIGLRHERVKVEQIYLKKTLPVFIFSILLHGAVKN